MVKKRLNRMAHVLLALALLVPVTAAMADEILFVPISLDPGVDGTNFVTRLLASNLDDDDLGRVSYVFVPQGQSGVEITDSESRWSHPGASRGIEFDGGAGLLVVTGSPEMIVNAAWEPRGAEKDGGAAVPVLRQDRAGQPDAWLHLQGLERRAGGTEVKSSLAVINLGADEAGCLTSAYQGDGTALVENVPFSVPALSSIHVLDPLGVLGLADENDVRIATTCDQIFSVYSVVSFMEDGRAAMIRPSAPLDVVGAGDDPPGDDPPGDPGSNDPVGEFVYLSDIPWSATSSVQTGPHKDRAGWEGHAPGCPCGGYKTIQIAGQSHAKGVSWFGNWSQNSSVFWNLDGQYRLLDLVVGFDDSMDIFYEWALVDTNSHLFIRLQRPPDGWGGRERPNQFRVGAGGTLRFYGDGQLIHETAEFHGYSPAVPVTIDVRGVQQLRVEMNIDAHEELNAWYRNGLTRRELVRRNSWFDHPVLASPRLFLAQ